MHQDEDLNTAVKTYILQYASEILHCDQWRNLEKNLPQLAIETLRGLLLDIRKERRGMSLPCTWIIASS
ncbi:hypothetical protein HNY73_009345 [Argiope bruennichi]|uniref:Uncharacterized protein n=1 Tax=Argiope bruennichi TaxID=94029 RepID=A0A8T0FBQ6_ARGBR|nr:hypothetical protein HNY73_009345 [Argiope bruennichi]